MSTWKCSVCNVEVQEVKNIRLRLLRTTFPSGNGYRCPICSREYLSEVFVTTQLEKAELMLNGK